jgi:hypothetical protein
MSFDLGDYIDVNERITLFYAKHPDGSLGFEYQGIMEGNPDMIWGIAYAYRDRDDQRPGVGVAAELAKGTTPYTRHSELQNLQTSCWGRAIAALGIGLGKKGLATIQEIEAARDRQTPVPKASRKPATPPPDDPWGERDLPLPPDPEADTFNTAPLKHTEIPSCIHGKRVYKEGTSKTGKPWRGLMCPGGKDGEKCDPKWL